MEGLEAEFDRIYNELASDIFAYFNICFGANPAEDLTQEVFLRVWRQLQNGAAVENWRAWAFRCAVNLKNDFLRQKLRGRNLTDRVWENSELTTDARSPDDLDVRTAFCTLEEQERELLTLKSMGFNSREIAEMTGSTDSTVRTRLQKAKNHFKELIQRGDD